MGCSTPQLPSSFTNITRTISNESGHRIKIKSYFNQVNPPIDTIVQINLKNDESHTAKGVYAFTEMQYAVSEGLIETIVSVDSVVVVFDNEKFDIHCSSLIYLNCSVNSFARNIILDNPDSFTSGISRGYTLQSMSKGSIEWVYTITELDYEDAIDCKGDPRCDG